MKIPGTIHPFFSAPGNWKRFSPATFQHFEILSDLMHHRPADGHIASYGLNAAGRFPGTLLSQTGIHNHD